MLSHCQKYLLQSVTGMKRQHIDSACGAKTLFLGTFLLGVVLISCAGSTNQVTDDIKIVAHRGGVIERPENTTSTFRRAVELGSDIIEIDLRTSRDGQLFILHDAMLDRTTNGSGLATDLTLDELQQLDAGSWFDPSYSEERIPSFKEVLEWATGEEVMLLLDLKESGREFAENVAGEVKEYGAEGKVVVGIRFPVQAQEFRKLLPRSRQLAFMDSKNDIEEYADAGVDVIRLWLHWLEEDPALVDRVRQTGTKLMINGTTGELQEAKNIMSYNPDWILIDDPAQLIESLRELR